MDDKQKITMNAIINQIEEIPPFSQTVSRILGMTKAKDIGATELEKEILKDEGLTTQVLKWANSAFYRGIHSVETVREATVVLGFDAIYNMVLSTVVAGSMKKELPGYALAREALWRQSQISALMTRKVAKRVGYEWYEQAYTAGLLKDIGKVILDAYVGKKNQEIQRLVEEEEYSFLKAEEEILGYNHAEIGALIAKKWHLSESLVEVIAYHHTPKKAIVNKTLVAVAHLADGLIMMMGIEIGRDGLAYSFDSELLDFLKLRESDLMEMMSEVTDLMKDDNLYFD